MDIFDRSAPEPVENPKFLRWLLSDESGGVESQLRWNFAGPVQLLLIYTRRIRKGFSILSPSLMVIQGALWSGAAQI